MILIELLIILVTQDIEYLNPLILIESKPNSRELMLSVYKYSRGKRYIHTRL